MPHVQQLQSQNRCMLWKLFAGGENRNSNYLEVKILKNLLSLSIFFILPKFNKLALECFLAMRIKASRRGGDGGRKRSRLLSHRKMRHCTHHCLRITPRYNKDSQILNLISHRGKCMQSVNPESSFQVSFIENITNLFLKIVKHNLFWNICMNLLDFWMQRTIWSSISSWKCTLIKIYRGNEIQIEHWIFVPICGEERPHQSELSAQKNLIWVFQQILKLLHSTKY